MLEDVLGALEILIARRSFASQGKSNRAAVAFVARRAESQALKSDAQAAAVPVACGLNTATL
jgi:hypothetical protein